MVNVPAETQRLVLAIQEVQETVELRQVQHIDHRCHSCDQTPNTNHPNSTEDGEGSQSQFLDRVVTLPLAKKRPIRSPVVRM